MNAQKNLRKNAEWNAEKKRGLSPVYNRESQVLILGSFPSVISRRVEFYYGNPQNRFWKMLCGYFQENLPRDTEEKKAFLYRHKIALWDMVTACEIEGSSDSSVQNAELADLSEVLKHATIQKILLNGTLSYQLFVKKYASLPIPYEKMPSTSSANPKYDESVWHKALAEAFRANCTCP